MTFKNILYYLWPTCLALFHLRHVWAVSDEQVPLKTAQLKPNILFILTDDQDLHMDSLSYMPYLKKHLIDHGLSFQRHYCTVALCCPSRVSLWTGKAAHNTNVTDINPPYGGYPKFVSQGFNDNYLPLWLQMSGYSTYYVGKLFNAQSIWNYDSPHAAGWTASDFLLDPYTYRYLNATFQRNHDKPVGYEGQYSTDVLARKAQNFLEDALDGLRKDDMPFFLAVAPTAPHSDVNIKQKVIRGNFSENSNVQSPPIPAERHKHLFEDVVIPRTPNFNPDQQSGASWIARLPQQNQSNIDFNDHFYRNRLRSLQAVDEMIDSLINRLEEAGAMDNTYIFYSTDNGYSIGQHRRQPGKQCAFEEDINVPLIMRGPGVPEGEQTNSVTSHTDLAPTFLDLAQAPPLLNLNLDGQAIPWHKLVVDKAESSSTNPHPIEWTTEHVNVEMWGIIMSEGKYGSILYPNHTYKALRVVGERYNLLYTVWCSGEHELYDMKVDPYQMDNLYDVNSSTKIKLSHTASNNAALNYSTPLPQPAPSRAAAASPFNGEHEDVTRSATSITSLIARLDSLLMVLKTCRGIQCTHPWWMLFPSGEVKDLAQALNPKYDEFFQDRVARIKFERCEKGYIAESEGPMWDISQAYGMVDEMAYE